MNLQASLPVAVTEWYLQCPFSPDQSLPGASLLSGTPRGPIPASLTDHPRTPLTLCDLVFLGGPWAASSQGVMLVVDSARKQRNQWCSLSFSYLSGSLWLLGREKLEDLICLEVSWKTISASIPKGSKIKSFEWRWSPLTSLFLLCGLLSPFSTRVHSAPLFLLQKIKHYNSHKTLVGSSKIHILHQAHPWLWIIFRLCWTQPY